MIFAGCSALFNLANLAPMWKFDGGQVLRQICPNAPALATASFALLIVLLGFGYLAGFSTKVLIVEQIIYIVLTALLLGFRLFKKPIMNWRKERMKAKRLAKA